ncbi:MAG: PIN/TRAM domain-containing protein [Verrucomicrobiae bacterium]|nr:PIN/TRAM domain-containing protein [Verrucomicrobiae bacterium]
MSRPTQRYMDLKHNQTPANVARAAFVLVATLIGISLAMGQDPNQGWIGALIGLFFGLLVVLLDLGLRNFSIRGFSSGTFGLLVGLLCAWLINNIGIFDAGWIQQYPIAADVSRLALYLGLGFIGMMLAIRSRKEEFSLVIPYVRFRQESVQDQPLLADANAIIDGRMPRLFATGFLSGALMVPRFVLDEIQTLADGRDDLRRSRGKRGLDCLGQLRKSPLLAVSIHEEEPRGETSTDGKLIAVARQLGARLLTNDANLAKVARLQGVTVLHMGELSQAMRPTVAPGDELDLSLVKEGKDNHQAVGYLPDGTMIVVNQAVGKIGTVQSVIVAGAVQTSAGRLIFAELKETTADSH